MKDIIFTNINFPGNVGDFFSSPLKYYNFDFDYKHIHFLDIWRGISGVKGFEDYRFKDCLIVIGGGGLITKKGNYIQQVTEYLVENNDVIFWSIGSNTTHTPAFDILYHNNVKLCGVRDIQHGLNIPYLPCVSCKHTLFDINSEESEGVGVYEHVDIPINIDGFDKIRNNDTIENIINFIKSKEVIITSTYHGIYWSQLLNKKVVSFDTGNTKMKNLKHRVNFCDETNYLDEIKKSSYCVDLLNESRIINDEFYLKVLDYVKNV